MILLQCFSNLIYLFLVASLHLQTQLAGCYPLGIIVTLVTHADNVTTKAGNNLTHANQLSGLIIQFYHERIGSATLEETTVNYTVQDGYVDVTTTDNTYSPSRETVTSKVSPRCTCSGDSTVNATPSMGVGVSTGVSVSTG